MILSVSGSLQELCHSGWGRKVELTGSVKPWFRIKHVQLFLDQLEAKLMDNVSL